MLAPHLGNPGSVTASGWNVIVKKTQRYDLTTQSFASVPSWSDNFSPDLQCSYFHGLAGMRQDSLKCLSYHTRYIPSRSLKIMILLQSYSKLKRKVDFL